MGMPCIAARRIGLGFLIAALSATAAQSTALPGRIAAPASVVIPCNLSPFGAASPVVRDLEAMVMLRGNGGNVFDEYRPSEFAETPPLQRVYRASLNQAPVSAVTFRKAVSADLNGDGRDEVVAAFSDGADIRLAVFSRTSGPTAQLIDTWTFTQGLVPDSIELVAGDLDGSNNRKMEIGVSWAIASNNYVRVMMLTGDSSGHIAHADGFSWGRFVSANALTFPRLAVGDFLLAGHDQLVLAGYKQSTASIELDLIELSLGLFPETAPLSTISEFGMRSAHYANGLHSFNTPQFAVDNAPNILMQGGSPGGGVIVGLDADGGDMVDSAAAELAVHLMFPEPTTPVSHVLAQRVMRFNTTRDINNAITAITLGDGVSNTQDSSIMLERYPGHPTLTTFPPRFAATVADVDAVAGKEIVTARAGYDGSGGGAVFGRMRWFARKVHVRLTPSFQYKNEGTDNGSNLVAFINNSRGDFRSFEWDFGDGSSNSGEFSPLHGYSNTVPRTVTLTATGYNNAVVNIARSVNVTGAFDANPQGDPPPRWTYKIDAAATYSGSSVQSYPTTGIDLTAVKLAVGDMNRDGLPEVMVGVNDDGIAVDLHVFRRQANGTFASTLLYQPRSTAGMELLLSDFDGDSLNAVLSGVSGDCRTVADKVMRSQTYMPPYFSTLQANSNRATRWGKSSSTSTSIEERNASYMSHDVTAYLGVTYELSAPILAIKLAEVELKGSLGYNYQTGEGELHGNENAYSIDQGFSIGDDNQSIDQEALLTTEQNTADCFSYKLATASGPVPGSALRSCEIKFDQKVITAPGAVDWNRLATEPPPIAVPYHWIPVQRDWASLAMFRIPVSGVASGPLNFTAQRGADKATDGLFDTSAESTGVVDKPYLQIDLGAVREIQSVRVFPAADPPSSPGAFEPIDFDAAAPDLQGFRLYASTTPFVGSNPPTSAMFTTFLPGGISTFVQDTGVEAVYREWNAWTGNPANGAFLQARYLRIQKPVSGRIRIAEIQVFGGTHSEPQSFPDAVCDSKVGDGLISARVYDKINLVYKTIHMRGDMMWTGAVDYNMGTPQASGVPGCSNDTLSEPSSTDRVRQEPIWQNIGIGDAGSADWALSQSQSETNATDTSIDGAVHVGVEFEATLGAGVQALVGASYEFTYGVTKENQTSTAMGSGFSVSGTTGGFTNQTLADPCRYFPRPFAFKATNFSNTGFEHKSYVTDYVVRQVGRANAWQRQSLPSICWDPNAGAPLIFSDGFE